MLTFPCATATCLAMFLGAGRIAADDGQHFLFATFHFKETYSCTRSTTSSNCRRLGGRDCPITEPWKDQSGRHQFPLDCR